MFVLRTITVRSHIKSTSFCPFYPPTDNIYPFAYNYLWERISSARRQALQHLSVLFPMSFLWITDSFLVSFLLTLTPNSFDEDLSHIYRLVRQKSLRHSSVPALSGFDWQVYSKHALVVLMLHLPVFGCIVTARIPPNNSISGSIGAGGSGHLIVDHFSQSRRFIPSLTFSCGLDAVSTFMIAGRLLYHHNRRLKMGASQTSPFLPATIIFIESAALSTIAKILQLTIANQLYSVNLLVIPLCVSIASLLI